MEKIIKFILVPFFIGVLISILMLFGGCSLLQPKAPRAQVPAQVPTEFIRLLLSGGCQVAALSYNETTKQFYLTCDGQTEIPKRFNPRWH